MRPTTRLIASAMLVTGLAIASPARPAAVEQNPPAPSSLRALQGDLLEQLAALAAQPGPTGAAAARLQPLLQAHVAYVEEVVLPPLALLPALASSDAAADMKWALPLVERARAGQAQQVQAHAQIVDRLLVLFGAAQDAGDAATVRLAQDIAAWLQVETEVTEPAAQLVGKYLRLRYASGS